MGCNSQDSPVRALALMAWHTPWLLPAHLPRLRDELPASRHAGSAPRRPPPIFSRPLGAEGTGDFVGPSCSSCARPQSGVPTKSRWLGADFVGWRHNSVNPHLINRAARGGPIGSPLTKPGGRD